MKQYTFEIGDPPKVVTSNKAHSFIFSFPAFEFQKMKEIELNLSSKIGLLHRVVLVPPHDLVEGKVITNMDREARSGTKLQISNDDANVVVRIVMTGQRSFMTYVNDEFIDKPVSQKKKKKCSVTMAGVEVLNNVPEQVVVTLTVFDQESSETAERFARRMRYPETSTSGTETGENSEGKTVEEGQQVEASEEAETRNVENNRETTVEAREKAVGEREQSVGEREQSVGKREQSVEERDKAAEEREKAVAEVEKIVADLQRALEEKEMSLKNREKDLARGGGGLDEKGMPASSLILNVNPPDADSMSVSTTMAWPRAVRYVLGASVADTAQQRHDAILRDWVIARGDNISSTAYDFFVYSHGVAWPQAILENTTKANLTKIRDRHEVIMEVLV